MSFASILVHCSALVFWLSFQLETLKEVAASWEDAPRRSRHPRLPVIMAHNDFVRQTFERVKANLDQMG